ncbi:hypothetical protein [Pedococcus sp. 5OH_020]|uniref:hypothetical protein n=1 Tax=Pedococcus sp. 5OH_020 TaxID=2989814 RepID=UPI0022E9CA7F|nr:hypothetical protein [Pedococcus sp. 5OH_020]
MTALVPPVAADTPRPSSAAVTPALSRDSRQVLADLRQAMNVAQVLVMTARRPPVVAVQLSAARGDYLATVLAYERALTTFRLPVPPRLRDEARLLRGLTSRR